MLHQFFFIFSFVMLCKVNCQNIVTNKNITTENVTLETDNLSSLCKVCNCTGNEKTGDFVIGNLVNCEGKGLKDHFEDTQWPQLVIETISFKNNSLVHITAFPKVSVKKLILAENQITKIDDCAFKKLINLTELDLSHNQLTSDFLSPHVFEGRFSPESYEPLSKLTILNLSHNILHSLHQDFFEHLVNLKVLNLAGNPFTTIDIRTSIALSSLPYLEELDMSSCELKSIPDHQFHTLRHLKKLYLKNNRLVNIPTSLEDATSLESVYLDENPIEVIDRIHPFPTLPKLTELSLCCMPHLTRIGPYALSGLTALVNLRIQNSPKLQEIDEDALVGGSGESAIWPPLKKLDLSDNALRYLPALLVGRWDRLEELDLMNNKWSCDCNNQYLIGSLLPKFGAELMGDEMNQLTCSAPPEMLGQNLTTLFHRKLRCLDLYDAQPEKDAAILVGILIGVLLAIPLGLALFVFWRRGFFFCGNQGPATFSRAFYKRAANDDDL